jgi:ATP-binding cassette subfamily B protein
MINKLLGLYKIFGKRDSLIFLFIIFFSIVSGIFEIIGIGLLAIFALIINDPSVLLDKIYFIGLKNYLKQLEKVNLIILISFALIIAISTKHLILFLASFVEIKVSKKIQLKLKQALYKYYLSRDYEDFFNQSKSSFVNVISSQTSNFMGYLYNIFLILKELILILLIFIGMLIVDWKIILILTLMLFLLTFFFIKYFKKKLNLLGQLSRDANTEEIKYLDETYQSYKIIKLERKDNLFSSFLYSVAKKKNYYEITHFLIGRIPKIYLEIVVLILFLSVILYLFIMNPNPHNINPKKNINNRFFKK